LKELKQSWLLGLLTFTEIGHTAALGQKKKGVEGLKEHCRGLMNRALAGIGD
jgi:hypothetical protein